VQKKTLPFKCENYSSGFDKRTGWRHKFLPRLDFDARNGQPPCVNRTSQKAELNGHVHLPQPWVESHSTPCAHAYWQFTRTMKFCLDRQAGWQAGRLAG
jgi:hypothetical protein